MDRLCGALYGQLAGAVDVIVGKGQKVPRIVATLFAGASYGELALVKVAGRGEQRLEALRLAQAFDARTIDATLTSFVFEITGATSDIERFISLMASVGLVEVSRTGIAAITRGPDAT